MIEGLLRKGWIEQRGAGNDTFYRITDEGLAAKMAPVRIYNSAFAVDRPRGGGARRLRNKWRTFRLIRR
jgi:hypothetical protein